MVGERRVLAKLSTIMDDTSHSASVERPQYTPSVRRSAAVGPSFLRQSDCTLLHYNLPIFPDVHSCTLRSFLVFNSMSSYVPAILRCCTGHFFPTVGSIKCIFIFIFPSNPSAPKQDLYHLPVTQGFKMFSVVFVGNSNLIRHIE